MRHSLLWIVGLALCLGACKGEADDTPWCSDAPTPPASMSGGLTYYKDVKPILDQKCVRCHSDGGHAPFALSGYQITYEMRALIKNAVSNKTMPPFLAASCCTAYYQDFSLTPEETAVLVSWVDQDAPLGDPAAEPPQRPVIGGLSRVDLTLEMPYSYTPSPPPGSTDDVRCFVVDWPISDTKYVTGLNPVPGARSVVHHLIVGAVTGKAAEEVTARDGKDGRPGFDCKGGFGDIDITEVNVLGGSLLGGDFPRGLGKKVEAGAKILFNIHYSTAKTVEADRTQIEFRLDKTAREGKGIAIANPMWLVDDAMLIPAGEKDAVFFYRMQPDLYTRNKAVMLESVTPHMHYYGSKMVVRALHKDGSKSCLMEIPRWNFGWEQPFWLAEPKRLEADDELYIECHFDNSAENQPPGQAPRDIAWGGNNQDMCAAFLAFTDVE